MSESCEIQLPLGGHLVYETDDLMATREHLAKYLGRHTINLQGEGYPVSFRHCGINIGRIGINALYYGTAIRIGVCPPENTFFLLVLLRGSGSVRQQGHFTSLEPGYAYIFNPGVHAVLDLSADMMNFVVKLSKTALTQFLERETGKQITSELLFTSSKPGSVLEANGLQSLLLHASREIDDEHVNLQLPVLERQWEKLIYAQVLAELPHTCGELVGMEEIEAVPDHVRKVEAFIADHFTESISLSDLSDCASVSERALQNSFCRFRNTTPTEYLRDYRLNQSRQLLCDIKYLESTISDIASACGFSHLSKFAKCYRERFGETPSATRKKIRPAMTL